MNVSASLPVDVPPGASDDDVRTAFNVKSISADEPIKMLVDDPDKFFGRTTKVCGGLPTTVVGQLPKLQHQYGSIALGWLWQVHASCVS